MTEPAEPSTATTTAPTPPAAPRRRTLRVRLRHFRARVRRNPRTNLAWRLGVGLLGTIVLVLGVLAIPYPGPGWLIVFAGLGILATEFTWAGRVLRFARHYYDLWVAWLGRQTLVVKLLVGLATFAIVLATLWLLGALALVAGWVGLDSWTWLQSPILG